MAGKHGSWTVLFEDRIIMKKCDEFTKYNFAEVKVNDEDFWNQEKFNGINAIQFTNDGIDNDQVETDTANLPYDENIYGSFQQFVDKFDLYYLDKIQSEWDESIESVEDPVGSGTYREETEQEKISRLGPRPTSYTSNPIT